MDALTYFDRTRKYDAEYAEKVRKMHLSNSLNTNQKMELYNCAVNGNVETLKNLIDVKKYPLMEECSASGYYWTVIHYAAHYGFVNVVNFVLEYYQNNPNRLDILNLQSNLGLSPLFISINNNSDIEKKNKFSIYMSNMTQLILKYVQKKMMISLIYARNLIYWITLCQFLKKISYTTVSSFL